MRRRILGAIGASAVLVAVLGLPVSRADTATRTQTTTSSVFGVRLDEVVLENGFRLLVVQDYRVPRVAASLWYRFGGLAERSGEHGAAHFLEHAVHQGTTTVGVTDIREDRALQQRIMDTEQELIRERNAHRMVLREQRVFFNELEWPVTEKMQELRRKTVCAGR